MNYELMRQYRKGFVNYQKSGQKIEIIVETLFFYSVTLFPFNDFCILNKKCTVKF